MTSPAMRYATTSDGVNIAYVRVGEGAPIVFASHAVDAHVYLIREFRGVASDLASVGWEAHSRATCRRDAPRARTQRPRGARSPGSTHLAS